MQAHRSKRHRRRLTAAICCAVLLVALLFFTVIRAESVLGGQKKFSNQATVTIGGNRYRPKDQTVILIMGTDDLGPIESSDSYENYQQADFLTVLAVNKKSNSYTLLHIDRDTMTEVDLLSVTGARTGRTVTTQIALSHNYGDGLESSCLNTKRAISNLLLNLRIDYYVALNMSAVEKIVDHFGGVPMTMEADHTDINPAYTSGAQVILDGEAALHFVRARMGADDGTNASRMERQRSFIYAFSDHIRALNPDGSEFSTLFLDLGGNDSAGQRYVITDATVQALSSLLTVMAEGTDDGLYTLEGTHDYSGTYAQFYPDTAALEELVTTLYYRISN